MLCYVMLALFGVLNFLVVNVNYFYTTRLTKPNNTLINEKISEK